MNEFIKKITNILTIDDKKYLIYLFIFTIAIAFIETLGVSVIMPFLSIANDFSVVHSNKYYKYLYDLFNFNNEKYFVVSFGIIVLFFYLFRAVINSVYIYLIMYFINSRYDAIANKLFKQYISLSYKNFIKQNTSALTKVIINEAANITELFWFSMILISELLVLLFIYSFLMYINYKVTLTITAVIFILGIFLKTIVSTRMKYYGLQREINQKDFYELLNRSFNNVKMIKLDPTNSSLEEFSKISRKFASTKIISGFLQQFPRFIFEFTGFSLVVIVVLYHLASNSTNTANLLSIVSVFVLGLFRLLPSITRIFLSYNTILFQYKSLDIVYNDLNLDVEILGNESINFSKNISLENISFSYDCENVISNLSLVIEKNDKIAFIGESGSGKSTLVDIIMGLHHVTDGKIHIDDKLLSNNNILDWRGHFGYIPQSVYLFDGTVAQNVAFGSIMDEEKIIDTLKKANIWEFLKDKGGLSTVVGESGILLSGGQKQRIAIARALYKNPEILVLDEATSALDDETEGRIMDEIYELAQDKTLIIIAHRLNTIRRCNKVYTIGDGKINV